MPAAALEITENAVRSKELQHAVGIIRLGATTKEAKMIVCVPDNGNQLAFHAEVLHFSNKRFYPALFRAHHLPKPRANRPLCDALGVVCPSNSTSEHKGRRPVQVISSIHTLLERICRP